MENVTITFNKEDSSERTGSGTDWFYGQAEVNGKIFDFSICELNIKVGGQNTSATEITWIDDTPDDSSKIKAQIEKIFEIEFVGI